jgi:type IV pilus assembly protein PilO
MRDGLLFRIISARPLTFVFILIILIINILGGVYIYYYQSPQIADLQSQWFAQRQGVKNLDSAALYNQGIKDLQAWEKIISPKRDFTRLIGELFELAAKNSLKVKQVTYKPKQLNSEKLVEFSIEFNVTGKYAEIKNFIADLANSKEILVIDGIALSSGDSTKESVSLKVQLTAYFRMV